MTTPHPHTPLLAAVASWEKAMEDALSIAGDGPPRMISFWATSDHITAHDGEHVRGYAHLHMLAPRLSSAHQKVAWKRTDLLLADHLLGPADTLATALHAAMPVLTGRHGLFLCHWALGKEGYRPGNDRCDINHVQLDLSGMRFAEAVGKMVDRVGHLPPTDLAYDTALGGCLAGW